MMKITKIEPQKRRKNRWSIFINGEFSFGISADDLYHLGLKEGQIIEKKELKYIEDTILYTKGKDKALHLLSYRSRTEKEIRQRLYQEFYPKRVIDRIVDFLYKYSFLDDKVFAEQFVKSKMQGKPMGKKMLVYQLEQKGVSKDIAEIVIAKQDINEVEAAYQLIKKRVNIMNITEFTLKEKQRVYNYLQRRGFSYDSIYQVLDKLEKNIQENSN